MTARVYHNQQKVSPTPMSTTAAGTKATWHDAVHLAQQVGGRTNPTKVIEETNQTLQDQLLKQRKKARGVAERKYREDRILATRGLYDEAAESLRLRDFPKFTTEEICPGGRLGNGSFGTVYEVKNIQLEDAYDSLDHEKNRNRAAKSFMVRHCLRDAPEKRKNGEGQDARYAIKLLRSKIVHGSTKSFVQGMIDMANETRLLASIPHHPNIIKLRGVAQTEGASRGRSGFPAYCFHEDYFLIIDRLYGTLEERIEEWIEEETSNRNRIGRMFLPSLQRSRSRSQRERLVACHDLASGLAHLHTHRIIHRDIKPANIGFNIRGDLTLFDFGLSRELPSLDGRDDDGLYKMTGFCGSPRYMAPEIGLKQKYNESCDVYSFGVLAWQILTLQKPYLDCDVNDLKYIVWSGNNGIIGPGDWTPENHGSLNSSNGYGRHSRRNLFSTQVSSKPNPISDEGLADVIDRTFSRTISTRPTMHELELYLQFQCAKSECTSDMDTEDESLQRSGSQKSSRRRSTYIFQNPPGRRASSLVGNRRSVISDNTHHGADAMQSSETSGDSSIESSCQRGDRPTTSQ